MSEPVTANGSNHHPVAVVPGGRTGWKTRALDARGVTVPAAALPLQYQALDTNGREPKPPWLKVKLPMGENYARLKQRVNDLQLHTVCESARCPNIGECWGAGTLTMMILGDICTRACRFCAITTGRPTELDLAEPARVAAMIAELDLTHAVITSVARDDLADGGAALFAATIREVRRRAPQTAVEVLIPDLKGDRAALAVVLAARPDILNHNIETVERLSPVVRPQAQYRRSLRVLELSRDIDPAIPTKSGIMLGLGETRDEIIKTLTDLRAVGCDILTMGQYLRPTGDHLPVVRFVPPAEFDELKAIGEALGFRHVEAGPLVRSSYHAERHSRGAAAAAA